MFSVFSLPLNKEYVQLLARGAAERRRGDGDVEA